MERITEKKENGFYELKREQEIYGEENGIRLVQIVGQYEDKEEELGIDLLTREKALQNGAWYKSHSRGIVFCPFVRVVGKGKALELKEGQRTPTLCAKTCDYGKTWALTKEELL